MFPVGPVVQALALLTLLITGCGTDTGQGPGPSGAGDAQTPPAEATSLEAWLATGVYKAWACEAGPMDARPNGAHGRNRVCSNGLMSRHGAGEYPVGSAAVKELFDGAGAVTGYAVSRHFEAGTTAGTWYWYERSGSRVVADGVAAGLCTGCHSAAGTDARHQGHDFVYLQVK